MRPRFNLRPKPHDPQLGETARELWKRIDEGHSLQPLFQPGEGDGRIKGGAVAVGYDVLFTEPSASTDTCAPPPVAATTWAT